MSSRQDQTTIRQAVTRLAHGGAQLEVRDASFAASDGKFASAEDFTGHLCEVLGAQPVDGGVRGSMSVKGSYRRHGADGGDAVTFGDVVLDETTSASGALILGDRRIDVAALGPVQPPGPPAAPPIVPADNLVYTGDVNGTERWVAPDQSMVQFRTAPGVTLTFHAWKRSHWYGYWSMGAGVTADGLNYDAGIIDSNYYMTVPDGPACAIVKVGESTDQNNNYFNEWQWGWNSQQPERVASFCRVQWRGARFADLVTVGSGCDHYKDDQWPTGFPPDWPPLPTGIEVRPGSITMTVKGLGLNDAATATVLNHTTSAITVQVEPPASNDFSWPSGTFTAPAYGGQLPIQVMFDGGSAPGYYRTSVRIQAGGLQFTVPVTVNVISTYPPK
jgi:hypothetical protein